jgi:hypothetical protein
VEKNGGCNKITCGACKRFFCWLCNQTISGVRNIFLVFLLPAMAK